MKRLAFLGIASLLLVGCGEPTIDVSSEESMQASIKTIQSSLSEADQKRFEESLMLLATASMDMGAVFSGNFSEEDAERQLMEAIGGKTADEVFAAADAIMQERKERQRLQALGEIRELEQKLATANEAKQALKAFEVKRSRFYMEEDFAGSQPVIEVTVKNGTEHAISRAYFATTIASPDRQVPWSENVFNFQIPGGMEPGEEAEWRLNPNRFSDWGKINAPADAIFTVVATRIDGPDGTPILSAANFTDADRRRLEELRASYPEG